MSISSEITRINNAKKDIITSIENKGIDVKEGAKIDELPSYIDRIDQIEGYSVKREKNDDVMDFSSGMQMVGISDYASISFDEIKSDNTHSFDEYTHLIRLEPEEGFSVIVSTYMCSSNKHGLLIEYACLNDDYTPIKKFLIPELFTTSNIVTVKCSMHSARLSNTRFVIAVIEDGTGLAHEQIRLMVFDLTKPLGLAQSNAKDYYESDEITLSRIDQVVTGVTGTTYATSFRMWWYNCSRGCKTDYRLTYISAITPLSENSFLIPAAGNVSGTSKCVYFYKFEISESNEIKYKYQAHELSFTYNISSSNNYYFNKMRIVPISDEIYLGIMGIGTSETSAIAKIMAIKITSSTTESGITIGEVYDANFFSGIGYYDVISYSECTGKSDIAQAVIVTGLRNTAVTIFTANIDTDSLAINIATLSTFDETATPSLCYGAKNVTAPTSMYNFVKLIYIADILYLVSLSYNTRICVKIGEFKSNGLQLETSTDYDITMNKDLYPELFFDSNVCDYVGRYSITNYYTYGTNLIMMSTSMYGTSSYYCSQSTALFVSIWLGTMNTLNANDHFTINSEIPLISRMHELSDNRYLLIDEWNQNMRSSNDAKRYMLRMTMYEFKNGKFVQRSGGKIIPGILNASVNTLNTSSIFVGTYGNDDVFAITLTFLDNVIHDKGLPYIQFIEVPKSSMKIKLDHGIGLFRLTRIESVATLNLIRCDGVGDSGVVHIYATTNLASPSMVDIQFVQVKTQYASGSTGGSAEYRYFFTTGPAHETSNESDAKAGSYTWSPIFLTDGNRSLYWKSASASGAATYYGVINPSEKISLTNTELTTNTVDGIKAGELGSNNLISSLIIASCIFHDNIICAASGAIIYTYYWDPDDNKFYLRCKFTNPFAVTPSTYARNNWYIKISEYELLITNSSGSCYALLHISKSGKISVLSYAHAAISSANRALTSDTLTPLSCRFIMINGEPYILNPAAMTAHTVPNTCNMAVIPVKIHRLYDALSSYVIGNSGNNAIGIAHGDSEHSIWYNPSTGFTEGHEYRHIIIPEI